MGWDEWCFMIIPLGPPISTLESGQTKGINGAGRNLGVWFVDMPSDRE